MSSLSFFVLAVGVAFATPAAGQVRFWQDPVVTYTNGMRLASTTSQRSHDVYWRCDVNSPGYCDGRMHGACVNDLRSIGTRNRGCYCFSAGPRPGAIGSATSRTMDGLESEDSARLGTLRVASAGGPVGSASRVAAASFTGVPALEPAPLTTPPADDAQAGWYGELKRLGEKVQLSAQAELP